MLAGLADLPFGRSRILILVGMAIAVGVAWAFVREGMRYSRMPEPSKRLAVDSWVALAGWVIGFAAGLYVRAT
jgi:hypothetical protein